MSIRKNNRLKFVTQIKEKTVAHEASRDIDRFSWADLEVCIPAEIQVFHNGVQVIVFEDTPILGFALNVIELFHVLERSPSARFTDFYGEYDVRVDIEGEKARFRVEQGRHNFEIEVLEADFRCAALVWIKSVPGQVEAAFSSLKINNPAYRELSDYILRAYDENRFP